MASKTKEPAFCPNKSLIKLVVRNKANEARTVYSFLRDDRKGSDISIRNLYERIVVKFYSSVNNLKWAEFYDNQSKRLLFELDSNSQRVDREKKRKSKVKLVIYDSNNKMVTHFSNHADDQHQPDRIVGILNERYLKGIKINNALFYCQETGQLLEHVRGYGRA